MSYEESIGLRLTSDVNDFVRGTKEAETALGSFGDMLKDVATDSLGDFVARQRRLEHGLGSIGKSIDWINRRVGAVFLGQAIAGTVAARSANNYNQSLKSVEFMARKTGSSLMEVNKVIARQSTGLASRAMITEAMQGLMQTKLTVKEMENVIKIAKDAATLKPWIPLEEQLRSITSGIRQLNGNLIDNFVEVGRLDNVYARYARTVNKSAAALTVQEKQQAIVNAMMTTGSAIVGQHEKALQDGALAHQVWKRNLSDINIMLGEHALPIYKLYGRAMVYITDVMKETIQKSGKFRETVSDIVDAVGITSVFTKFGEAITYPFNKLADILGHEDFASLVKDKLSNIAAPIFGLGITIMKAGAVVSTGFAVLGAAFKLGFKMVGTVATIGFAASVLPAIGRFGKILATNLKTEVAGKGFEAGMKGIYPAIKKSLSAMWSFTEAAFYEEGRIIQSSLGIGKVIEKEMNKGLAAARIKVEEEYKKFNKIGGKAAHGLKPDVVARRIEEEAAAMASKNTRLTSVIANALFGPDSLKRIKDGAQSIVHGMAEVYKGLNVTGLGDHAFKQTKDGFKEIGKSVRNIAGGMRDTMRFAKWGTIDKGEIKNIKEFEKTYKKIFEELKSSDKFKGALKIAKAEIDPGWERRLLQWTKAEAANKAAAKVGMVQAPKTAAVRAFASATAEATIGVSNLSKAWSILGKVAGVTLRVLGTIGLVGLAYDLTNMAVNLHAAWRKQIDALMDYQSTLDRTARSVRMLGLAQEGVVKSGQLMVGDNFLNNLKMAKEQLTGLRKLIEMGYQAGEMSQAEYVKAIKRVEAAESKRNIVERKAQLGLVGNSPEATRNRSIAAREPGQIEWKAGLQRDITSGVVAAIRSRESEASSTGAALADVEQKIENIATKSLGMRIPRGQNIFDTQGLLDQIKATASARGEGDKVESLAQFGKILKEKLADLAPFIKGGGAQAKPYLEYMSTSKELADATKDQENYTKALENARMTYRNVKIAAGDMRDQLENIINPMSSFEQNRRGLTRRMTAIREIAKGGIENPFEAQHMMKMVGQASRMLKPGIDRGLAKELQGYTAQAEKALLDQAKIDAGRQITLVRLAERRTRVLEAILQKIAPEAAKAIEGLGYKDQMAYKEAVASNQSGAEDRGLYRTNTSMVANILPEELRDTAVKSAKENREDIKQQEKDLGGILLTDAQKGVPILDYINKHGKEGVDKLVKNFEGVDLRNIPDAMERDVVKVFRDTSKTFQDKILSLAGVFKGMEEAQRNPLAPIKDIFGNKIKDGGGYLSKSREELFTEAGRKSKLQWTGSGDVSDTQKDIQKAANDHLSNIEKDTARIADNTSHLSLLSGKKSVSTEQNEIKQAEKKTGFASGGFVYGNTLTDKIPAWLNNEEFVINKQAMQKPGAKGLAYALNYGGPENVAQMAANYMKQGGFGRFQDGGGYKDVDPEEIINSIYQSTKDVLSQIDKGGLDTVAGSAASDRRSANPQRYKNVKSAPGQFEYEFAEKYWEQLVKKGLAPGAGEEALEQIKGRQGQLGKHGFLSGLWHDVKSALSPVLPGSLFDLESIITPANRIDRPITKLWNAITAQQELSNKSHSTFTEADWISVIRSAFKSDIELLQEAAKQTKKQEADKQRDKDLYGSSIDPKKTKAENVYGKAGEAAITGGIKDQELGRGIGPGEEGYNNIRKMIGQTAQNMTERFFAEWGVDKGQMAPQISRMLMEFYSGIAEANAINKLPDGSVTAQQYWKAAQDSFNESYKRDVSKDVENIKRQTGSRLAKEMQDVQVSKAQTETEYNLPLGFNKDGGLFYSNFLVDWRSKLDEAYKSLLKVEKMSLNKYYMAAEEPTSINKKLEDSFHILREEYNKANNKVGEPISKDDADKLRRIYDYLGYDMKFENINNKMQKGGPVIGSDGSLSRDQLALVHQGELILNKSNVGGLRKLGILPFASGTIDMGFDKLAVVVDSITSKLDVMAKAIGDVTKQINNVGPRSTIEPDFNNPYVVPEYGDRDDNKEGIVAAIERALSNIAGNAFGGGSAFDMAQFANIIQEAITGLRVTTEVAPIRFEPLQINLNGHVTADGNIITTENLQQELLNVANTSSGGL